MIHIFKVESSILLFFLLIYNAANAQQLEWQNTIGSSNLEWLHSMEPTRDGNFLICGYTGANVDNDRIGNSNGFDEFWVLKVDGDSGNIIWRKLLGGRFADTAIIAKETSDGGYIVAGNSVSPSSGDKTGDAFGFDDYWVVKLDANRNILWDRTFGGGAIDRVTSIIETASNGFMIVGESASQVSGNKTAIARGAYDIWVINVDGNGTMLWQETYGGSQAEITGSIVQTPDGGYLISASSLSDISGNKTENNRGVGSDYWVIKINSQGSIIWQNTYGGDNGDNAFKIISTSDGNYIVGGTATSNISGEKSENSICQSPDNWLIKIDPNGSIIWDRTIGGDETDFFADLRETADGGVVVGSTSFSNISGFKSEPNKGEGDYWFAKLDTSGNIMWDKSYGGTGQDHLSALVTTPDGTVAFAGWSNSPASGDKNESLIGIQDYWIGKFKKDDVIDYTVEPIISAVEVCEGSSLQLTAPIGRSYSWRGPNGFTSQIQNPIITNATSQNEGVYNLIIQDNSFCVSAQIINVSISQAPTLNDFPNLTSCDEDQDKIVTFNLSEIVSEALAGRTNLDVVVTNSENITLSKPLPSNYEVSVLSEDTITVKVFDPLNPTCFNQKNFQLIAQSCDDNIDIVIDPISTEFPRFFTPNFDGFNDRWPYESLNDDNIESIAIFDRYGKLLKTLYPNDGGWNGIYNGEQMPSSDYWYTAMMKDGSALNNHFTLKR